MYSLRILNTLNIYRRRRHPLAQHPVYLRDEKPRLIAERRRKRRNRLISIIVIPVSLYVWRQGTGAFNVTQMVGCVGPILTLYVLMVLWTLPLGSVISPALAEERTRNTWDLIRITPLDRTMLLLAKMRTRVNSLKDYLAATLFMLILFAGVVGLSFAASVLIAVKSHNVVLAVVIASIGGLIFVMDRLQQLVTMGIAAAAGGSLNHTVRAASAMGIFAALMLWLAEVGWTIAILLIGNVPRRSYFSSAVVLTFTLGPVPAYVISFPLWRMLIATMITFIARELAIRVLWRWALHAMQR